LISLFTLINHELVAELNALLSLSFKNFIYLVFFL